MLLHGMIAISSESLQIPLLRPGCRRVPCSKPRPETPNTSKLKRSGRYLLAHVHEHPYLTLALGTHKEGRYSPCILTCSACAPLFSMRPAHALDTSLSPSSRKVSGVGPPGGVRKLPTRASPNKAGPAGEQRVSFKNKVSGKKLVGTFIQVRQHASCIQHPLVSVKWRA
jgi:hypothetical protein